jgi:hypothetical protein
MCIRNCACQLIKLKIVVQNVVIPLFSKGDRSLSRRMTVGFFKDYFEKNQLPETFRTNLKLNMNIRNLTSTAFLHWKELVNPEFWNTSRSLVIGHSR